jgi:hypothetical protein
MFLYVLQSLAEQREDVLVVERVINEPAFTPRTDHPRVSEKPKLVRNGRLREAEQPGKMADAQLAARQHVEDADPRGIPEYFEDIGKRPDRIGVQELGPVIM